MDKSAMVPRQRVLVDEEEWLIGGGLPVCQTVDLVEAEPVDAARLTTCLLPQELAAATAGNVQS